MIRISLGMTVLILLLAGSTLAAPPYRGPQYVRGQNGQIVFRIYPQGNNTYQFRGTRNEYLGKYNSKSGQFYNNRGIPSGKVR